MYVRTGVSLCAIYFPPIAFPRNLDKIIKEHMKFQFQQIVAQIKCICLAPGSNQNKSCFCIYCMFTKFDIKGLARLCILLKNFEEQIVIVNELSPLSNTFYLSLIRFHSQNMHSVSSCSCNIYIQKALTKLIIEPFITIFTR